MDRAQAFSLEGTVGAIVIITAVLFGLQAIDTGPETVGRQPGRLATQADDVLEVAHDREALSQMVRCYRTGKPLIDGNVNDGQNSRFEEILRTALDEQNREYQLYISHWNESGGRQTELVSARNPQVTSAPDPATGVATQRLALYDNQPIRIQQDCSGQGPSIDRIGTFYIPDVNDASVLYNVVEVRLVVW